MAERREEEYGDGISWIRSSMIGRGSSGRVNLATLRNPTSRNTFLPPLMAVKSAEVSISGSIQKEREAYNNLRGSPYILECYGDEITTSCSGGMMFNLLLEYGSGGTLSDRIKQFQGNGLGELETRFHARSILRGLRHIHDLGYVHCDLKPDNIMLVPIGSTEREEIFRAKIGDLGLTKRAKQRKRKLGGGWEGTPMYLSPETVMENVQEEASDVWAVGCIVLEMLTGKSALGLWGINNMSAVDILRQIGTGRRWIEIPSELSEEARGFLRGCFERKSECRWTCVMLLNHPFLWGLEEDAVDDEEEEEFSSDEWSHGSEDDSFSDSNTDDELVSESEEEE